MDKEYALIYLPAFSWILFALGGKKFKFFRRFLLPMCFLIFALLYEVSVLKALLITLWSCFIFHQGYGETKSYFYKFIIGCDYGLISYPIGLTFWNYFTPFLFTGLFWLSNHKPFSKVIVWKIVEGITGLIIGLSIGVRL